MKTFTRNDGFTEKDLLQFGYSHIEAAYVLFKDDPIYYDSAGYLAHLGTELLLKAWHLFIFGEFKDTHRLNSLYEDLRNHKNTTQIAKKNVDFLEELDRFYFLRYPRLKEGPVEVGNDMLSQFDALLDDLWQVFPPEIIKIHDEIGRNNKGGRILMQKKQ
jgi:HEPN domain-containing protein